MAHINLVNNELELHIGAGETINLNVKQERMGPGTYNTIRLALIDNNKQPNTLSVGRNKPEGVQLLQAPNGDTEFDG